MIKKIKTSNKKTVNIAIFLYDKSYFSLSRRGTVIYRYSDKLGFAEKNYDWLIVVFKKKCKTIKKNKKSNLN